MSAPTVTSACGLVLVVLGGLKHTKERFSELQRRLSHNGVVPPSQSNSVVCGICSAPCPCIEKKPPSPGRTKESGHYPPKLCRKIVHHVHGYFQSVQKTSPKAWIRVKSTDMQSLISPSDCESKISDLPKGAFTGARVTIGKQVTHRFVVVDSFTDKSRSALRFKVVRINVLPYSPKILRSS